MAVVSGTQGTAGNYGIFATRVPIHMKDGLAELEPNKNPLLLFLRKASKGTIDATKHEWLEHDRFADATDADGTALDSDTTISVVDGTLGAPNMLFRVQRTGEVIRVGAVSTNDWTGCTRSVGGTVAAAILDGDDFTMLGTSFAENSSTPTPRVKSATTDFNYTQIWRDTFGASGTLQAIKLYGSGKPIMSERAVQISEEHNLYQEKSLLWGEASQVTSGDYAIRTMGGIDEFISASHDFGGSFSMTSAFDALEDGMRFGSPKKMLVCSRSVASNISLEALGKVRNVDSTKTLGINISMLESPHGQVAIMRHNLLTGTHYGTRAYLLDMKNFRFLSLKGRDTGYYENLETNGTDGMIHGYLTEATLERMHDSTHQTWLNVSNG